MKQQKWELDCALIYLFLGKYFRWDDLSYQEASVTPAGLKPSVLDQPRPRS